MAQPESLGWPVRPNYGPPPPHENGFQYEETRSRHGSNQSDVNDRIVTAADIAAELRYECGGPPESNKGPVIHGADCARTEKSVDPGLGIESSGCLHPLEPRNCPPPP